MFGLHDIELQYGGLKVLEHFNLNCDRQQFICLFGPSGTGKKYINILPALSSPDPDGLHQTAGDWLTFSRNRDCCPG